MAYGSSNRGLMIVSVLAAVIVGLLLGLFLDNEPDRTETQEVPTAPELSGPGPTGDIDGVPVGYAQTEQGAVTAAANFNLLSAKDDLLAEGSLAQAMRILAAPDWVDDAERQGENGYEYIVNTYGADADVSAAILRYQLADFSSERATVRLWLVTTISGSERPNVETIWGIVTTDLLWVEDDWRVTGIESSPGPAPVELPSHQSQLTARQVMEDFDEFRGAPVP